MDRITNLRKTFFDKCDAVHGKLYDYSTCEYINSKTPITVVCKTHGKVSMLPRTHLTGVGCPRCGDLSRVAKLIKNKTKSFEDFVENARRVHGDTYTYTESTYVDRATPTTIVCSIHGEFTQKPADHLSGNGCQTCGTNRVRRMNSSTTAEFVDKAKTIHGDSYTYNNTVYISAKTPVLITCRHHGDFLQVPNTHLDGSGCRHCRTEKVGWEDSKWAAQGAASRRFTGYSVYVLKLYNDDEVFYKIGKTFVSIKDRTKDLIKMYDYEVIARIPRDAKAACELERQLHRVNRENKYVPKHKFSGYTECYNSVCTEGLI